MSAVHALAYGMLEIVPTSTVFFTEALSADEREQISRNEQIVTLVKKELAERGFLLSQHVNRFKSSRGGMRNTLKRGQYDLFSPQLTQVGFGPRRTELGEGLTLKEACLAALAYIEPNNKALQGTENED
jgi:hypothetical protein